MKKVAIFVEGQTELIVVRDYLLKYFDYSNIDLICRTLFTDNKFHKAEYDVKDTNAEFHFQVINVGNDNAVLSRILRREEYMWNAGYQRIIGLRDMYGKKYRNISSEINAGVNEKFIAGALDTINKKAKKPENVSLCFAIMETEAWFLGIESVFEKLNSALSSSFIEKQLNLNLKAIDPEKEFFHPAQIMEEIYSLIGKSYNKKKGDIEAIVSHLTKEDFEELRASDKCSSFSNFHNNIMG